MHKRFLTFVIRNKKTFLFGLLFVVLAVVTVLAVMMSGEGFSGKAFWNYLTSMRPGYFLGAVGSMLCFIFFEAISLHYLLKKLGYRRGYYKNTVYAAADIYFSALTPSATGGQLASAYFMAKDKVPLPTVSVALLLNLAMYCVSLFVLGGICFVARFDIFLEMSFGSRALIVVGMGSMVFFVIFFFLLIFKEKMTFAMLSGCIRLLSRVRIGKLRLIRRPEKKLKKLEKTVEEYGAAVNVLRGCPRILFVTFFWNMMQRIAALSITVFVYYAALRGVATTSVFELYLRQGYVLVGANSVPIPGAMGVTDYLFLDAFKQVMHHPQFAELVSRGISFYASIFLCGMLCLVRQLSLTVREAKSKRKERREGTDRRVTASASEPQAAPVDETKER